MRLCNGGVDEDADVIALHRLLEVAEMILDRAHEQQVVCAVVRIRVDLQWDSVRVRLVLGRLTCL